MPGKALHGKICQSPWPILGQAASLHHHCWNADLRGTCLGVQSDGDHWKSVLWGRCGNTSQASCWNVYVVRWAVWPAFYTIKTGKWVLKGFCHLTWAIVDWLVETLQIWDDSIGRSEGTLMGRIIDPPCPWHGRPLLQMMNKLQLISGKCVEAWLHIYLLPTCFLLSMAGKPQHSAWIYVKLFLVSMAYGRY